MAFLSSDDEIEGVWRQLYKNRSSGKTDSQKEPRSWGSPILLKTVSENRFSGKTYFIQLVPDGAGVGVDERRLGGGEGLLVARLAVDLAVGCVLHLCRKRHRMCTSFIASLQRAVP